MLQHAAKENRTPAADGSGGVPAVAERLCTAIVSAARTASKDTAAAANGAREDEPLWGEWVAEGEE